jgi:hypothetical protein
MKNIAFLASLLFLISCNTGKKVQSGNQLFLTGIKWTILKIRESMVANTQNARTIELSYQIREVKVHLQEMPVVIQSMANIKAKKVAPSFIFHKSHLPKWLAPAIVRKVSSSIHSNGLTHTNYQETF